MNDSILNIASSTIEELCSAGESLATALDTDWRAREALKHATIAAECAETPWLVEAMMNLTGKNAEQRKAELDLALLQARQTGGPLHATHTALLEAQQYAMSTSGRLEIAKVRFAASKAGAAIMAAAIGAE